MPQLNVQCAMCTASMSIISNWTGLTEGAVDSGERERERSLPGYLVN